MHLEFFISKAPNRGIPTSSVRFCWATAAMGLRAVGCRVGPASGYGGLASTLVDCFWHLVILFPVALCISPYLLPSSTHWQISQLSSLHLDMKQPPENVSPA